MEIKGTIEQKKFEEGTGKNGKPYKRWVFTIDNKKYSTFDDKIGTVFNEGQNVVIIGDEKNGFFNMKEMKAIDGIPEVVKINGKQEFHLSREECRARSLEIACDMIKNKLSDKMLFELAEKIFQYINS